MKGWLARNIKGDKATWAIILMFTLFSFLAVYSASTNLVYVENSGTIFGHLRKHAFIIMGGIFVVYIIHKIPYRFSRPISKIGIVFAALFLILAALKGITIGGANASRWIKVPFVDISFQPSAFALVILLIYVASYLAENHDKRPTFSESLLPLWLPVGIIVGLTFPSNLSTALLISASVLILTFIGRLPFKNILIALFIGIVFMVMFVLTVKAFPDTFKNTRVNTWVNRIESFITKTDEDDKKNKDKNYQIERSKMAIAKGGILGEGAGKSTMKNFLPESTKDFIYAIITEEYGLAGAIIVMFLYVFLLLRIVIISQKAKTIFGQLLVLGVGLPIILQALINMGVAVELFPVTGQNLPLISSGGTSIWMTCLALGIILSVSTNKRNKGQTFEKDEKVADVEEELAEEIMKKINKKKNDGTT